MKGQAAFELLATYGWVILLIITVAGTISYLSFVNPSEFLGETCNAGADFGCDDFALIEEGGSSRTFLALRNKVNEPLRKRTSVFCEYKDGFIQYNLTDYVMPGEIFEVNCIGPDQGWNLGQKRKINFKIVYYTNITTPGIPRASNGFVFAKVK